MNKNTLFSCIHKLAQMRHLTLSVESFLGEPLRRGIADVIVTTPSVNQVIVEAKGSWVCSESRFTNSFRFTLDQAANLIAVEHLRYGKENPVLLFHLKAIHENELVSVNAHLCGKDSYTGRLLVDKKGILFECRVTGPQKNHLFSYHYT